MFEFLFPIYCFFLGCGVANTINRVLNHRVPDNNIVVGPVPPEAEL